jgi:hypothetical protein
MVAPRNVRQRFKVNWIRALPCSFCSPQHDPDRLILAPEAVVTTAAAQSCADREKLDMPKESRRRGAIPAPRKGHDVPPARTAAATALMAEAGMTKCPFRKFWSRMSHL